MISMLDGSNLSAGAAEKSRAGLRHSREHGEKESKSLGLKEETGMKVGMAEQAAIAIADIAFKNNDMQDAIIEANGVPPLLTVCRTGSQLGQEHAARAIWHLAASPDTHTALVEANAIPDLVQLLKTGSPKAQEMAAPASPTSRSAR